MCTPPVLIVFHQLVEKSSDHVHEPGALAVWPLQLLAMPYSVCCEYYEHHFLYTGVRTAAGSIGSKTPDCLNNLKTNGVRTIYSQ